MSKRDKVAIFGDLTALYSCRTRFRRGINYAELFSSLKNHFAVDDFDDQVWYSLFAEGNEKQKSFVDGLTEGGWKVSTAAPNEVRRLRDSKDYRFDSRIGFDMGLAVDQFENVVIVSDSFDLIEPLRRFHKEDPDTRLHLAFYRRGLDPRWKNHLNEGFVNFIDLDSIRVDNEDEEGGEAEEKDD